MKMEDGAGLLFSGVLNTAALAHITGSWSRRWVARRYFWCVHLYS
jgi:hypothetical protein